MLSIKQAPLKRSEQNCAFLRLSDLFDVAGWCVEIPSHIVQYTNHTHTHAGFSCSFHRHNDFYTVQIVYSMH